MSESNVDLRFGIFVKEDNFKLVEVETTPTEQFRINKIIQTKLDSSLDADSIQNDHEIIEIGNQIQNILNVFNISVKKAIFTLESPFALVKKMPIDANLPESRVIDQVDWEVKQFSFSPDDEYIVDFQKLGSSTNGNIHEMVIVSVRERVIQQLRKMFAAGKISVNVIDLDVFAAIRAIEVNYDLKADELVVLIEIEPKGFQLTIIKDKEFHQTHEVPLINLGIEANSLASVSDEEISKLLSRELKRFISDSKVAQSIDNINRIFLYGDLVKDKILENLQNDYNVIIDKTNPFKKLYIGPNVSVDEKIWTHPETFTVCVGSALRWSSIDK